MKISDAIFLLRASTGRVKKKKIFRGLEIEDDWCFARI
jgi:hypothetical protein